MLSLRTIFIFVGAIYIANFVKAAPKCKSGDLECIVKRAQELVANVANGVPELGIPPAEPFVIHNVKIDRRLGVPINMKLFLKRSEIRGLSKQHVEKAVGFTNVGDSGVFELYSSIPTLTLSGEYKVDGQILLLPIRGEGEYKIILENVKSALKVKYKISQKNGRRSIKLSKVKVLVEPTNVNINVTNLISGNKKLSESINEFLNENWRDAWNELAPAILVHTANYVKDAAQRVFDGRGVDAFFVDL